jgi:hypothetical protein
MWKYDIPEQLTNCPPTEAISKEIRAFRVIKNNTPTDDDFRPYSLLKQANNRYPSDCRYFALSFFGTYEKAAKHAKTNVPT